jgi:hypothetical protein
MSHQEIALPPSKIIEERFGSRIAITDDVRDCWRWSGISGRYGVFSIEGVIHHAHRIAWAFAYGRDPGELIVLHSCDSAACCNPRHLRLGTAEDNARDTGVLPYVRSVLARTRRKLRPRGTPALNVQLSKQRDATRPEVPASLIAETKAAYQRTHDVSTVARELGLATSAVFDILTGRAVPARSAP